MNAFSKKRIYHAFTLVEVMVTVSIAALVGGMIFLVLNAGMNLYAKNTAVNAAHQQARSGVDQLLTNVHGAVSIPQLVMIDTTANPPVFKPIPTPTPGATPGPADNAAGLSYQRFEAGPFPVVLSASASSTSIDLDSGAFIPSTTTRLNIPTHNIELDVVSNVNLGSGKRRYNFSTPIKTAVAIDGDGEEDPPEAIVTAFMTYRVSYAVVGAGDPTAGTFVGELRFYPTNNVANYRVIARNVTSDKPFTIPIMPITGTSKGYLYGGEQNRYVAAVNISTVEPQFSKRGYAAVNMFISSLIPFRCRMTTSQ